MYSTSIVTHSLNGTSSLFFLVCQMQVRPGFTRSLFRSSLEYWTTSFMIGGLGPTSDIEPRNTFKSCGSSSMLVSLKKCPIFVTLGSSCILNAGPSLSLSFINESSMSSAPITIDRNLYILNVFPLFPTLSET